MLQVYSREELFRMKPPAFEFPSIAGLVTILPSNDPRHTKIWHTLDKMLKIGSGLLSA